MRFRLLVVHPNPLNIKDHVGIQNIPTILDDAGSETRPPLLKGLVNITLGCSTLQRLQEVEDLQGDGLLYYDRGKWNHEYDSSFSSNEIYNSVDLERGQGNVGRLLELDYDEEYEQDDVHNHYEDPLASAMLLLAKAITQNFSNPTNNRLRCLVLIQNQAVVQQVTVIVESDSAILQRANAISAVLKGHYDLELSRSQGNGFYAFADASRMKEIEELSANICLMARIQPADQNSDDEPSYESAFISKVQSSSINENDEQMYPTHTKIINSTIDDDQINSNIQFVFCLKEMFSSGLARASLRYTVYDLCALEKHLL
ncbi:hypothetical protein Tco_1058474 [Tanacetum coccineum]|uniref:Uncharacterized protein n=1 Tax=Tanacetum coccineum TaxID=301880 RepID=A0ABQ5HA52_9ASTR